jgi:hypothetical protein
MMLRTWSLITESTSSASVSALVGVGYVYDPSVHAEVLRVSRGTGREEHRKMAGTPTFWLAGSENTDAFRFVVTLPPEDPQSYFWTEAWQEGEREADEDIRLRRTRRFIRVKDAIAWLERAED